MINVVCPICGKTAKVDYAAAGKKYKCPECGELNRVPDPAQAEHSSRPTKTQLAVRQPHQRASENDVIEADSEPLTHSRGEPDKLLYRSGHITVTSKRLMVGNTIHLISKINSISIVTISAGNVGCFLVGFLLVLIVVLLFAIGAWELALLAGAAAAASVAIGSTMSTKYALVTTSSSGQQQLVVSKEFDMIEDIADAVNKAIG